MSDLYDADIVVWSEAQAALLRRLAAGERVNDRFASSMRQRLNIAHICRRALRAVPATMYGEPRPPLPLECPWSLDELLWNESDGS
jgi:hypothetical protein